MSKRFLKVFQIDGDQRSLQFQETNYLNSYSLIISLKDSLMVTTSSSMHLDDATDENGDNEVFLHLSCDELVISLN